MKGKENPFDYPFLRCKDIMMIMRCGKDKAYEIIADLERKKDENGNLIIDKSRMPPINNIVPTDIFCKVYHIPKKYIRTK